MKKLPQRSCISCRTKKDKKDLIRIVKNENNEINIDKTGKKPGRGAYICDSIECLEKIIKFKKLDIAFKSKISEKDYEKLREDYIKEQDGGDIIG